MKDFFQDKKKQRLLTVFAFCVFLFYFLRILKLKILKTSFVIGEVFFVGAASIISKPTFLFIFFDFEKDDVSVLLLHNEIKTHA